MTWVRWRSDRTALGMSSARLSLMSFLAVLACGAFLVSALAGTKLPKVRDPADEELKEQDGDWRSHPALAEPDGESHRNGRVLVGDKIKDPRVLAELSRRFRATKPLTFVKKGDDWDLDGAEDFEVRQEYFLRLLDYYLFRKDRLTGMTRRQIQSIFGPGGLDPRVTSGRLSWGAGRDSLFVHIRRNRVVGVQYCMGY